MNNPQLHKQPKCVYVDVDQTLLLKGEINTGVVDWVREKKELGYECVLWSARGKEHATDIAVRAGLIDVFDAIVSKPRIVVDDQAWRWIRNTMALTPGLELHGRY